ncbi:hypothetical protein ACFQZC_00935 [Streptacidiphilus monticola]
MDSGAPDLTKFPDYQGQKFVIAPGKTSDRFIMAKVEITGLVKSHVTGCLVKYTQGSQHYVQTLHCEYALDSGSS